MAVRYSGPFTIRVNFRDRSDDYGVTISRGKRRVWSGSVGTPRSLSSGVDSPAAYDAAARAALSFADSDGRDVGDADFGAHGYHVSRSRAVARRKNPSKKRPSARACSSRGHTLRVAGTSRSGKALRQCRTNPSDGYTVKVTGRRPYHASSYNDALWHAKRSTATTNSRVKAVLYQGDKAVWLMTGGQVVTFYR